MNQHKKHKKNECNTLAAETTKEITTERTTTTKKKNSFKTAACHYHVTTNSKTLLESLNLAVNVSGGSLGGS